MEHRHCRRIMGIYVEINHKSKVVFLLIILDMLVLAGIWEKIAKHENRIFVYA
jgi:hypothetical protein